MSRFREPFNGFSHLVAAYIAVAGLALLVFKTWDDAPKRISVLVYGASLALMLTSSAAYHSLICQKERIRILRKIDHASIYALIAGTYTPICYNLFQGFWQWGLLSLVWGLAIAGMVGKIFHIHKSDWRFIGIYLALGWLCILGTPELFRALSTEAITWLFAGGGFYTFGALVVASKRMDFFPGAFGHHEVWHLFVAAAAFCHYILILNYVIPIPRAA